MTSLHHPPPLAAVVDRLSRGLRQARTGGHAAAALLLAAVAARGAAPWWPALAAAAVALAWPPFAQRLAAARARRWRAERRLLAVDGGVVVAVTAVLAFGPAFGPAFGLALALGALLVVLGTTFAWTGWRRAAAARAELRRARRTGALAQRALDELDAGVALYGADDRLQLRNRGFREKFAGLEPLLEHGTPFEALARAALGRRYLVDAVDDTEAWLAERLRQRGAPHHVTLRERPGDRWERIVDRRLPDGCHITFATDVTDLVRQKRELDAARRGEAASRQRLVDAIEALPDGFVHYDADDRLVLCNRRYRELYTASAPAMQPGATFEAVLRHGLAHGQYAQAVGREEAWLAQRLALHHAPQGPFLQPLADGRWLRVQETRTAEGGLVGFRTDVTDLVQREQALAALNHELATTAAALASREAQLAGIVDSASDGILTVDARQQVVFVNPAARRMFGLPDDALPFPLADLVPPPWRGGHHRHVAGAFGAADDRLAVSRRLLALRRDGHEFPIEITVARHGSGDEPLMTAIVRDVTATVEAERARADRIAAESATRGKTEFIARLGHELRTPLNAVLGYLQLLERQAGDADAPARLQPQALRASRHLSALVDDLLDTTRIDAGAVSLDCRPQQLLPVVNEAVAQAADGTPRPDVTVEVESPDDPALAVLADASRLRQVVVNLVANAVRYSPPAGSVRLRLAAEADGLHVRLDVADHGPGLTPAQREHLFEPFHRLGVPEADVEGTGMGLVVARQLAALMNGTIEVDGDTGRGTCLRLRLPRADAAPRPRAPAPTAPRRVLYVEDNPVNAMLVAEVLSELRGVTVDLQDTGAKGLAAALDTAPALVLLDLELPDMHGLDVLARLRAAPATRATPVFVLSANAMPGNVRQALGAGADRYLTKPLDIDGFLAAVDAVLPAAA